MPIETIQREGDFVIDAGGVTTCRLHAGPDSISVKTFMDFTVLTLEEARELADWIYRRLEEPLDLDFS